MFFLIFSFSILREYIFTRFPINIYVCLLFLFSFPKCTGGSDKIFVYNYIKKLMYIFKFIYFSNHLQPERDFNF